MAVALGYKILIGDLDAPTDFTDRCSGFSIRQNAEMSNVGIGTAKITLYNYDGALTPGAGGTYGSVDWFKQAVFIQGTISGSSLLLAEMFHGVVTGFDIEDNGVHSTVTLTCEDSVRYLGTDKETWTFGLVSLLDDGFTNTIATATEIGVNPPKLGKPNALMSYFFVSPDNDNKIDSTNASSGTVTDLLRNQLLPSYPSAYWGGIIEEGVSGDTLYSNCIVGGTLTRPTSDPDWFIERADLTFTEQATTTGEIPFVRLLVGFNNDNLVNQVFQKTSATGNEQSVADSTSLGDYGARTVTNTAALNKTDAFALDAANNFLNRQNTPRYVPERMITTRSVLESAAAGTDEAIRALLDIRSCFWNYSTVEYTPTGASTATTEGVVIVGRQISATPSDTTITLELLPAVDYQSFVLDSSTLGVLDQNRLG